MSEWIIEIAKIAIPVAGAVAVAWVTARASTRKEQGALTSRVAAIEDTEPADVQKLRTETTAAHAAAVAAQHAIDKHLEDERDRRRTAAQAGRARDKEVADRLDKIAAEVQTQGGNIREQGAQLDLLLAGKIDMTGGRRGR